MKWSALSVRTAALGATLALAASASVARPAQAPATNIPTLFSTGVLADGTPAPNGSDDLHYQAYNWTTLGTLGTAIGPARLITGYQPTGTGQTSAYPRQRNGCGRRSRATTSTRSRSPSAPPST